MSDSIQKNEVDEEIQNDIDIKEIKEIARQFNYENEQKAIFENKEELWKDYITYCDLFKFETKNLSIDQKLIKLYNLRTYIRNIFRIENPIIDNETIPITNVLLLKNNFEDEDWYFPEDSVSLKIEPEILIEFYNLEIENLERIRNLTEPEKKVEPEKKENYSFGHFANEVFIWTGNHNYFASAFYNIKDSLNIPLHTGYSLANWVLKNKKIEFSKEPKFSTFQSYFEQLNGKKNDFSFSQQELQNASSVLMTLFKP